MTASGPAVVALGKCCACRNVFTFCPVCVSSVLIDPETNLPPDVSAQGELITPGPDAMRRSIRQPVCEPCTTLANGRKPASERQETETQRHARHVG